MSQSWIASIIALMPGGTRGCGYQTGVRYRRLGVTQPRWVSFDLIVWC